MRLALPFSVVALVGILILLNACSNARRANPSAPPVVDLDTALAQTRNWTAEDRAFFLHGTMSTEVVPERVLRAFIVIYPDLFPSADLSHLGLLPDPSFGWPIGFSRRAVKHLGGLPSVGVNCAACHVADIESPTGGSAIRVLGGGSHFDAEAFFGAVAVATFRTSDVANMKRFLAEYIDSGTASADAKLFSRAAYDKAWQGQAVKIATAISEDPAGAKGAGPGGLHEILPAGLNLTGDADLAALSASMLKLFHNMRAALHAPDQPPEKLPPSSGPGRNDAFGLLSAALFSAQQPYAPVKYGIVWNLEQRDWVHWDGNTRSPVARNILASLGLGAPLIGKHGEFDFVAIKRQTELSEQIRAPKYPFAIDRAAAGRGAALYQQSCAKCHDGPQTDEHLFAAADVGTDPARAMAFSPQQADRFNTFLAELESPGYRAPDQPGVRSTGKYYAPNLAGVWARSPYLHNGSVRTMQELLSPVDSRAVTFRRGSRAFDEGAVGYRDAGPYIFDTRTPGNSNSGHLYGTDLTLAQKKDLIEHLKSL